MTENDRGSPTVFGQVPLVDGADSTIAMVDAVTGAISSQYAYNPLGGVAVSGTGYQTQYQYLEMENDGFAYYGGSRYYSPIMGRMLSLQGPLSSSGGRGSGVAPVASAMGAVPAADPGANPGFSPVLNPEVPEYASAGAAGGFLLGLGIGTDAAGSFGPVGALIGGIAGGLAGLFQDLFGRGGGGPPPWVIWKLNHRGGDLQNWARINGVDEAWALDWSPVGGGVELVDSNTNPPLQKRPDPTAMPTPQPRCQPSIAWAFLMAAEFNYDMYKGGAEGFERGLVEQLPKVVDWMTA